MKTLVLFSLCSFLASCSSTITKVNEASSGVSSGASALENASSTIDRAIATEKRIEKQWGGRK